MSDPSTPISSPAQPQSAAVVALYDTAIGHIARAAAGARGGDFETQLREVLEANRIFNGLEGCLDMERGGDVATNLRDLYQSMTRALLSAVGQPDGGETCDKLIAGLRQTRNAWAEIAGLPATSGL